MRLNPFQVTKNGKQQRRMLGLLLAALMGVSISLGLGEIRDLRGFGSQPATAQSLRPESVAAQIYQRLPNMPRENQYVNRETGKVDPDNTLVSRLIRYHQYVKNRPAIFRLDWKLTLADYIGINERIIASSYPGNSSLETNPLEGDLKVIGSLNRRQRDELVQALVNIYNPQKETPPTPTPSAQPTPKPSTPPKKPQPIFPKPGDADLLKF